MKHGYKPKRVPDPIPSDIEIEYEEPDGKISTRTVKGFQIGLSYYKTVIDQQKDPKTGIDYKWKTTFLYTDLWHPQMGGVSMYRKVSTRIWKRVPEGGYAVGFKPVGPTQHTWDEHGHTMTGQYQITGAGEKTDVPCDVCGSITVKSGDCYKCLNCGNSMSATNGVDPGDRL